MSAPATPASETLSPCPYCGGQVRMMRKSGRVGRVCPSHFYREHVSCDGCGAKGPIGKRPGSTVARWNRVAGRPEASPEGGAA